MLLVWLPAATVGPSQVDVVGPPEPGPIDMLGSAFALEQG
jgi:hypothetical protein